MEIELKLKQGGYLPFENQPELAKELMEFFKKGDEAGAAYAMAIHMHHSIDVMGLGTQ